MYETGLGRFCQRDPIGYVDGWCLYVRYSVQQSVDPSGLIIFVPDEDINNKRQPYDKQGTNPKVRYPAVGKLFESVLNWMCKEGSWKFDEKTGQIIPTSNTFCDKPPADKPFCCCLCKLHKAGPVKLYYLNDTRTLSGGGGTSWTKTEPRIIEVKVNRLKRTATNKAGGEMPYGFKDTVAHELCVHAAAQGVSRVDVGADKTHQDWIDEEENPGRKKIGEPERGDKGGKGDSPLDYPGSKGGIGQPEPGLPD